MSRLVALTAAADAYVLGAKAGTQRYEQIRSQAQRLWRDPRVQQKKSEASELVKDQASKMTDSSSTDQRHSGGADGSGQTNGHPSPGAAATSGAGSSAGTRSAADGGTTADGAHSDGTSR